jgi:hypothetical protein
LALILVCPAAYARKVVALCSPPPGGLPPPLPARLLPGQGDVVFPATISDAQARKFFNQGVAQMHSLWLTEAERSFLQASALEPEAPMPYWGIAMVAGGDYGPGYQTRQDSSEVLPSERPGYGETTRYTRAKAAAERARSLAVKPGKATPLERLYINAVWFRRQAPGEQGERQYVETLRQIVREYPGEVEARLYLSLHLMDGYVLPHRQPGPGTKEALTLLLPLRANAANHPGVHHYLMHALEWGGASEAKTSCDRYPRLVPNIPHALHYPAHLWIETGEWELAERALVEAGAVEAAYLGADQTYDPAGYAHNLHTLVVVYCEMNKYDLAIEASRRLLGIAENPKQRAALDDYQTPHRQGWFAVLRTLLHFNRWQEILNGRDLAAVNKPREAAWLHWARALAWSRAREMRKARYERDRFRAALRTFRAGKSLPPELDVASLELEASLALAAGNTASARRLFASALEAERLLPLSRPHSYPRLITRAMNELGLQPAATEVGQ